MMISKTVEIKRKNTRSEYGDIWDLFVEEKNWNSPVFAYGAVESSLRHLIQVDYDYLFLSSFGNASKINIIIGDINIKFPFHFRGFKDLDFYKSLKWPARHAEINIVVNNVSTHNEVYAFLHTAKVKYNSLICDEDFSFDGWYIGVTSKYPNRKSMYALNGYLVDETFDDDYFILKNRHNDFSFLNDAKAIVIDSATKLVGNGKEQFREFIYSLTCNYRLDCHCIFDRPYKYEKTIYEQLSPYFSNLYLLGRWFGCDIIDYPYSMVVINKDDSANVIFLTKDCRYIVFDFPISSRAIKNNAIMMPHHQTNNKLLRHLQISFDDQYINNQIYRFQKIDSWHGSIDPILKLDENRNYEFEITGIDMDKFLLDDFSDLPYEEYINNARITEFSVYNTYRFKIYPLTFDYSYSISDDYLPMFELCEKWIESQDIVLNDIAKDFSILKCSEDNGVYKLIKRLNDINIRVDSLFQKKDIAGFIDFTNDSLSYFCDLKDIILEGCQKMFLEIYEGKSNPQIESIDNEINGYIELINAKQQLIDQDIDALSNRIRIENLREKIDKLNVIKDKYKQSLLGDGLSIDDECKIFVDNCHKVIDDPSCPFEYEHFSNNESVASLNNFISNYLGYIAQLCTKCTELSKTINDLSLPNDYVIYEKEGQKYIVISSLDEYKKTKDLREKYNLKYLVRQ